MTQDEIDAYYMAMSVCDYNYGKAQELIKLISLLSRPKCKMPDVKMVLPEDNCFWIKEDSKCFIDMPDSIHICNGKCERYKEK